MDKNACPPHVCKQRFDAYHIRLRQEMSRTVGSGIVVCGYPPESRGARLAFCANGEGLCDKSQGRLSATAFAATRAD
jgi:hypothetical protein